MGVCGARKGAKALASGPAEAMVCPCSDGCRPARPACPRARFTPSARTIDACMWTGACMMSLSTPAGGDRQRSDGESEVSTPQHYRMSQPKPVVVHPACRNAPPLRRAVAKQSGWKPSYRSPKPTELEISSDERSCPCPNGRQKSGTMCIVASQAHAKLHKKQNDAAMQEHRWYP